MDAKVRRPIAALLVVFMTVATMPLPARAELLGTEAGLTPERVRVVAALKRPDVRAELQKYGANPAEVEARVAALSDEEVTQLAGRIDKAAAGGFVQIFVAAVLAAVLLVGLVLKGIHYAISALFRAAGLEE